MAEGRAKLVAEIEAVIAELEEFSSGMMAPAAGADRSLRAVIDLAVDRGLSEPWLDGSAREMLPAWTNLAAAREAILDIERVAQARLASEIKPQELLRFVRSEIARRDRMRAFLAEAIPSARTALVGIEPVARLILSERTGDVLTFDEIAAQMPACRRTSPASAKRETAPARSPSSRANWLPECV